MRAHRRPGAVKPRGRRYRTTGKSRARSNLHRRARRLVRILSDRSHAVVLLDRTEGASGGLPYDAYFGIQANAMHPIDGLLDVMNQAFQVGRGRLPMIDDEIGVLVGHRCVTDAVTLQASGIDEPRGVIVGRVGKYRAATPLADRL